MFWTQLEMQEYRKRGGSHQAYTDTNPSDQPRYGKRTTATGLQLTIGNTSGIMAPFVSEWAFWALHLLLILTSIAVPEARGASVHSRPCRDAGAGRLCRCALHLYVVVFHPTESDAERWKRGLESRGPKRTGDFGDGR